LTDTASASPTLLSPEQYLQALSRDGSAMHELLASDPDCLSAVVPSCPGWDVKKLISHLGRVFCSVREHVARRAQQMVPADEIPFPPEGDAIIDWFQESHAKVVEALQGVEPQEPIWSWAGSEHGNGAFYQRRMAHEVLIHRWDLEAALGEPTELPAELALDNVDELLRVVLPFTIANWERQVPQGSMHLHVTGLPLHAADQAVGEWLVAPVGRQESGGSDEAAAGDAGSAEATPPSSHGSYSVSYEHAKGDVAVRGAADVLALFIWERIPLRTLQAEGKAEVFGNSQLAEQWAQLSR